MPWGEVSSLILVVGKFESAMPYFTPNEAVIGDVLKISELLRAWGSFKMMAKSTSECYDSYHERMSQIG
jgi:hypothetical protein